MAIFYINVSSTLDSELNVMMSEFGHAIDLEGSTPKFRNWIRSVQTDPEKGLATIELYDSHYHLLERFGPKGSGEFVPEKKEFQANGRSMRGCHTALNYKGQVVGYLQLELPTKDRDENVSRFLWSLALISPFVLLGLGVSGYLVAGKAAAPLQESIERMRSFVADAGHELNTPLAILRARLETLERRHERQSIDTSDLALALKSMSRMEKTIEDLMLLAEFDSRIPVSDQKELDLSVLLTDLCSEVMPRFVEKGVALEHGNFVPLTVFGEPTALHRAIANLLENALRYTDAGGTVRLDLHCADGFAQVVVKDTGIGISPEKVDKIFDRFYRSDKSRSRASGGVGLGLSIVKVISEGHKGRVTVTSTPGEGSCFVFCLPLHFGSGSNGKT
ncbi:MAG: HAMP domain-containing histidine kinase [Candidatus Obscuribacterales bacterium]|nr:HAMP domain-containing histidine kinase [Candidatus Obscuribacterales bacterium]